MKRYFVDFSGYCVVRANSPEEAREIFEENISVYRENNDPIHSDVYEVEGVEEISES